METQNIVTTAKARITLKNLNSGLGWEIASSSSEDKVELNKIVKMLEEINKDMENKFVNKKEEVKK